MSLKNKEELTFPKPAQKVIALSLNPKDEESLIQMYLDIHDVTGISVERLAYSHEMRQVFISFGYIYHGKMTERELFWTLMNLRKKGVLKRIELSKQ